VTCLLALLARFGQSCYQGPPGTNDTPACGACTLVGLAFLTAIGTWLASLIAGPPWKGPRRLLVMQALQLVGAWSSILAIGLACGD
jgi:hypothetical protein